MESQLRSTIMSYASEAALNAPAQDPPFQQTNRP